MRRFPATFLLSLFLASPALADIRYHLTEIPTFGGTWSIAGGINNKGQIAGGASRANGIRRAFMYDNGTLIDMGSLFGDNGESIALAINEQGQLAGQSETTPKHYYAARFDRDRIIYIGTLGAGGSSHSFGINSHGNVVGDMHIIAPDGIQRNYHAFLFNGQTLLDLTGDRIGTSAAGDINDANQVVGYYAINANYFRGFFYDGVSRHDITVPGALGSAASGINDLGQVVGSIQTEISVSKPIIYEQGQVRLLPSIGVSSSAGRINNNGQILGAYHRALNEYDRPYISDGFTNLDLSELVEPASGISLQIAGNINDLGEIAGYGTINGQTHGFLLTPTQWKNDADGLWSDPANWLPSTIPDGLDANANFLARTTSPRTITLDSPRSTRTLNFRNPNSYTLIAANNASLTLGDSSNPAMINVIEGNHTIAAPLILAGSTILNITDSNTLTLSGPLSIAANTSATKWGDGTIEISGPQSHAANSSLLITRGKIILSSNAGPNLSLSITSNPDAAPATVTFHSDQDLKELSIDAASPGLQTLDLSGHTLTLHSPDLASAKSSLLAALRSAQSNPNDGLLDSTLSPNSTIALLEFPDHLLLRQAVNGDLNLDGQVTIADFIQLASHFDTWGPQISWTDGDLNYDSAVTIADFIDLSANFGAASDLELLNAFASSRTLPLLPEPDLFLLLFLLAALHARTTRHHFPTPLVHRQ